MTLTDLDRNYPLAQPASQITRVPTFDTKVSAEEVFTGKEDEFSQFFNKIREIKTNIRLLDTDYYLLVNPQEIEEFLFSHDHLFDFLFEARNRILEYFEHAVESIHLELQQDPEEDCQQLFVIIETKLPSDKALSLLNILDDKWWLNIDLEIRSNVEIDVEITG